MDVMWRIISWDNRDSKYIKRYKDLLSHMHQNINQASQVSGNAGSNLSSGTDFSH
jgi:hypothetical protein